MKNRKISQLRSQIFLIFLVLKSRVWHNIIYIAFFGFWICCECVIQRSEATKNLEKIIYLTWIFRWRSRWQVWFIKIPSHYGFTQQGRARPLSIKGHKKIQQQWILRLKPQNDEKNIEKSLSATPYPPLKRGNRRGIKHKTIKKSSQSKKQESINQNRENSRKRVQICINFDKFCHK